MKYFSYIFVFTLLLLAVAFAQNAKPGSKIGDINLPDVVNGSNFSLSANSDKKAIVLIFLSVGCPVSNAYNGRIAALIEKYSAQGVQFVGINSDRREKPADIKKHAAENGLSMPILKDKGNKIANMLAATVTPEVYVVSGDKTLLYHGRIDDSQRPTHVKRKDLEAALDNILSGDPVGNDVTKAFGCRIKKAL